MVIKIQMPALSPTMASGNLVKWNKNIGDIVKSGDFLFEIETDKSVMEYESPDEGVLAKIFFLENSQNIQVNELICLLAEDGEDYREVAEKFLDQQEKAVNKSPAEDIEKIDNKVDIINVINNKNPLKIFNGDEKSNRIISSPIARRLAGDRGLEISKINGSGPHGRITKSDVLNYKQSNTISIINNAECDVLFRKPDIKLPVSGMQKVIAERLSFSKANIPHYYVNISCVVDDLLEFRKKINESLGIKITINDIFVKAIAQAMTLHPEVNKSWDNNSIIQYGNVDISVAVDIPDGLITPIVKNADKLKLSELSNVVKDLVLRAKDGKLKAHEYQGGSITISNLGMFNIKNFSAIINPPQSSIISIGGVSKQPIVYNDSEIKIRSIVEIGISADHRVINGALCAKFLNEIKRFVENPILFLV
jgi:pyruvate dehydrogenase E2 component (dihydrolipoamide acetyltransferase)